MLAHGRWGPKRSEAWSRNRDAELKNPYIIITRSTFDTNICLPTSTMRVTRVQAFNDINRGVHAADKSIINFIMNVW